MFAQKFSEKSYTNMLMNLLPRGAAFPRDLDTDLYLLMNAWAQEFARYDSSLIELLNQSYPINADSLISEWEKEVGLPNCFPIPATLTERQQLVERMVIFPGALPTGYVQTGSTVKYSPIITVPSTSNIYVGEYVTFDIGVGTGKYKVVSITSTTIEIEQSAISTQGSVAIIGYICEMSQSLRFYEKLVNFLGSAIVDVHYNDAFQTGPSESGFDQTGDSAIGSPIITNITDTSLIDEGHYVSCFKGFPLKEQKVLSKTANTITLDTNATSTEIGLRIIGYQDIGGIYSKPSGVGDDIGDGFLNAVTLDITTTVNDALINCVLQSIAPGHLDLFINFV